MLKVESWKGLLLDYVIHVMHANTSNSRSCVKTSKVIARHQNMDAELPCFLISYVRPFITEELTLPSHLFLEDPVLKKVARACHICITCRPE